MKIIILGVRDTGGTGYTLAHAINKVYPDHQCVNMRAQHSYINFPTLVDMGDYSVSLCRKMVYQSDVIVFLGFMKPFFEGLKLNKRRLRHKKKILLCMGSEWRFGRDKLIAEANELLKKYQIVLGGSGMFLPYPEELPIPDGCKFLPVTRSFSEIRRRHSLCNQDRKARETFGIQKQKVVFVHAPTSDMKKGSGTFYRAVTRAMQVVPDMRFQTIRNMSWTSCLSSIARADVLFDQNPPFPVGYGAISVEASIFHMPVVTNIDPRCQAFIKRETGLVCPFITFDDDEDLLRKVCALATNHKVRRNLGDLAYKYCKALHDEKPVAKRFMNIVDGMN